MNGNMWCSNLRQGKGYSKHQLAVYQWKRLQWSDPKKTSVIFISADLYSITQHMDVISQRSSLESLLCVVFYLTCKISPLTLTCMGLTFEEHLEFDHCCTQSENEHIDSSHFHWHPGCSTTSLIIPGGICLIFQYDSRLLLRRIFYLSRLIIVWYSVTPHDSGKVVTFTGASGDDEKFRQEVMQASCLWRHAHMSCTVFVDWLEYVVLHCGALRLCYGRFLFWSH